MSEQELSNEAQQFVSKYILSLEQLEILILLSNSNGKLWSSGEVLHRIQSSQTSVVERLELLQLQKILHKEPGTPDRYQFSPSPELLPGIAAVIGAYQMRRVKLIEAIFSKPTDTVRSFADAFKLRKDK